MPTPIVVPKATISMEQGTILHWTKKVGEVVSKDESLLELETDKAVIELPSPVEGTILHIAKANGEVTVDQVIGWIGNPGDAIPSEGPGGRVAEAPVSNSTKDDAQAPLNPPASTPAARRRARELGLDLKDVKGSGPGGRITEEDVERASERPVAPTPSVRRAISEHVTEAWRTVPHIHIVRLMDATGLVKAKEMASADARPLSYTDLVLFTVARTLLQFPQVCLMAGREPQGSVSLAFAVDTQYGVVAPVIQKAESLSLAELARVRRELTVLADARKLKPEQVQMGDFTVTNLGMFEVDWFMPIINTPQVAILATGQVREQPVVERGAVRVGWRMWATLAADHRHVDGALAAKFLLAWQAELDRLPEL